ncbi:unnamed protein product [Urochloa humidicola]
MTPRRSWRPGGAAAGGGFLFFSMASRGSAGVVSVGNRKMVATRPNFLLQPLLPSLLHVWQQSLLFSMADGSPSSSPWTGLDFLDFHCFALSRRCAGAGGGHGEGGASEESEKKRASTPSSR